MTTEEQGFRERLVGVRIALNMNMATFSRALDLPRTTVVGWEEGKIAPIGLLAKLERSFGVNPDWFLSGEGPMFRDQMSTRWTFGDGPRGEEPRERKKQYISALDVDDDEPIGGKLDTVSNLETTQGSLAEENSRLRGIIEEMKQAAKSDQATTLITGEYSQVAFRRGQAITLNPTDADRDRVVLLPLFRQGASAGHGQETLDLQEVEDLVPVIQELLGHHRPQDCYILRVIGDSMTGMHLFNGDRVIFDKADREGDGVFVITHNQVIRVKRLEVRIEEKLILIHSENSRYPNPEVAPFSAMEDGRFIIEGKVIGWLHRHMY